MITTEHGASPDEAAAILAAVRTDGEIRNETAWATSPKGRLDIASRLAALRRAPDRPTGPAFLTPPPELTECADCGAPTPAQVPPGWLCRGCRTEVTA